MESGGEIKLLIQETCIKSQAVTFAIPDSGDIQLLTCTVVRRAHLPGTALTQA